MRRTRRLTVAITLALIGCLGLALYATRAKWRTWIPGSVERFDPAADPTIERRLLHEWVEDLSSADPDVRRQAAETLGNAGKNFPRANRVLHALRELLNDPDLQVRAAAVAAIGKVLIWTQSEVPKLLELARDDDATIRGYALEALTPLINTDERIGDWLPDQAYVLAAQ